MFVDVRVCVHIILLLLSTLAKVMTVKRLERAFRGLETVGRGSDYMSKLTQLYIRGMNFTD